MDTIDWVMQLADVNVIIYILRNFTILVFTYVFYLKIINKKEKFTIKFIIIFVIAVISIISFRIKHKLGNWYNLNFQILSLSIVLFKYKKDMGYTLIATMVSMAINNIIFASSVMLTFIPTILFRIDNDIINLVILIFIYSILLYRIFKIRRLKNGLIFLQEKLENGYFSVWILDVSVVIMLITMLIAEYKYDFTLDMLLSFVIIAIVMYITIKKSLELYYKQTLLIQELKQSEDENKELKNEIKKLEEENLSFSKKSHSLAHKQKSLERKIRKLMQNTEIAEEIGINDQVEKLSQELYQKPQDIEIEKTGIENIDDMLNCMKEECIENNIEFELKIYGNIYQMTNNYVTKDELEILIADHVKDAIIAINHTENINRSILVRIGKIDEIYSLYIYDSGIEFEPETLEKLGKEPVTTHKESGGTGMGFMNTFDTLKKNKASLIIKEYNKPCKENYTKVIIIKFDNKNEFKIDSYRKEKLKLSLENKVEYMELPYENQKEYVNLGFEKKEKELELTS